MAVWVKSEVPLTGVSPQHPAAGLPARSESPRRRSARRPLGARGCGPPGPYSSDMALGAVRGLGYLASQQGCLCRGAALSEPSALCPEVPKSWGVQGVCCVVLCCAGKAQLCAC